MWKFWDLSFLTLPLKLLLITILFLLVAEKMGLTTSRDDLAAAAQKASAAEYQARLLLKHQRQQRSRRNTGSTMRSTSTGTRTSASTLRSRSTETEREREREVRVPVEALMEKSMPMHLSSHPASSPGKLRTKRRPKLLDIPLERMERMMEYSGSGEKAGRRRHPKTPTMASFSGR